MNFKRAIAAVVCAAAVFSLTGCGKNETPAPANKNSIPSTVAQNPKPSTPTNSTPESSAPISQPEPEKNVIEMTDEIVNADFDSGLVQLNNEIFRQGGYITVADFVEKYKDLYEIRYSKAEDVPYEEFKDYLVTYESPSMYKDYYLTLTPKQGDHYLLEAHIVNATSRDERIAVSEAIVIGISLAKNSHVSIWAPGGMVVYCEGLNQSYSSTLSTPDGIVGTNRDHTAKSFIALLEEKGFVPTDIPGKSYQVALKNDKKYDNITKYYMITFYIAGKENLFGERPVYQYKVYYNENTEKIEDIKYEIFGFGKEQ